MPFPVFPPPELTTTPLNQKRQDDGGSNPRYLVVLRCGYYLQGSERDDCECEPSSFSIRRSERRATTDGQVCDIIVYPLSCMIAEVHGLGERLSFSMRYIGLPVLNRFQRSVIPPGLLLTHPSGFVHSLHRTGFCASKQL